MSLRTLAGLALAASILPVPAETSHARVGHRQATPELIDTARRRGEISRARADLLLARALGTDWRRVPRRYLGPVPWDGTLPLLRLHERLSVMEPGSARTAISEELAPGSTSGTNSCGSVSGGPDTVSSTYFYVEYTGGSVGGGLTIGDYTASLDGAWSTEVGTFGWAAPPLSSPAPPGNKYHVIVGDLSPGLFGFVTSSGTYAEFVGNNPNTGWNEGDAYATCMALNEDYSEFLPSPPQASLDATTAHEFNHSIQFGYGALSGANEPDAVFVEGGATWMEDEVYDGANDNYGYLWPEFDEDMGDYDASPYPYWVTFRGLTERYGTGVAGGGEQVMQDFWVETSKNTGDNLTAMQTAMATRGTTLGAAYHSYAIAAKFNRACGGGYSYPHCFEEGPAYVTAAGAPVVHRTISTVGGSTTGSVRDNYALNWVALPVSGGAYDVTLTNNSAMGGQLKGTVACDTGSGLSLSQFPSVVGPGGSASLSGVDPSGCSQVVLVLTNQSQAEANPMMSHSRSYSVSTAASTTPPTENHPRTVSLALRRHLVAKGVVEVTDGYAPCAADETVRIQRRKEGAWRTVKRVETGDAGRYRTRLEDRPGRYRASLAEHTEVPGHVCEAATSPIRRHRH